MNVLICKRDISRLSREIFSSVLELGWISSHYSSSGQGILSKTSSPALWATSSFRPSLFSTCLSVNLLPFRSSWFRLSESAQNMKRQVPEESRALETPPATTRSLEASFCVLYPCPLLLFWSRISHSFSFWLRVDPDNEPSNTVTKILLNSFDNSSNHALFESFPSLEGVCLAGPTKRVKQTKHYVWHELLTKYWPARYDRSTRPSKYLAHLGRLKS